MELDEEAIIMTKSVHLNQSESPSVHQPEILDVLVFFCAQSLPPLLILLSLSSPLSTASLVCWCSHYLSLPPPVPVPTPVPCRQKLPNLNCMSDLCDPIKSFGLNPPALPSPPALPALPLFSPSANVDLPQSEFAPAQPRMVDPTAPPRTSVHITPPRSVKQSVRLGQSSTWVQKPSLP